MGKQRLITALLSMLPGSSFAGMPPAIPTPEPGMLTLLGAGGLMVAAVAFFRRKK